MTNLLCQLKGHLWNECAGQNGHAYCDRCEREFTDAWGGRNAPDAWTLNDEVWHRVWLLKHRVRMALARLRCRIWLWTGKDKDSDVPF